LAAVTIKEMLEELPLSGTVRFYGCPAEEGGWGKTFMARAGAFDAVDAALTWHPSVVTTRPEEIEMSRHLLQNEWADSRSLYDAVDQLDVDRITTLGGSTDVGDVSWITPTVLFTTACFAFDLAAFMAVGLAGQELHRP
jgi:metal-dependent amidase/aminoacylase/carboxypeptidase family protein